MKIWEESILQRTTTSGPVVLALCFRTCRHKPTSPTPAASPATHSRPVHPQQTSYLQTQTLCGASQSGHRGAFVSFLISASVYEGFQQGHLPHQARLKSHTLCGPSLQPYPQERPMRDPSDPSEPGLAWLPQHWYCRAHIHYHLRLQGTYSIGRAVLRLQFRLPHSRQANSNTLMDGPTPTLLWIDGPHINSTRLQAGEDEVWFPKYLWICTRSLALRGQARSKQLLCCNMPSVPMCWVQWLPVKLFKVYQPMVWTCETNIGDMIEYCRKQLNTTTHLDAMHE